ncbi:uncharacterized protein LOC115980745 [Quercus lobata]|uniref:uncharacterized protein LOC115980745 n=1 Tax=Quercus lobata TaxID=97700 RepID=UPI0012477D62|nr:uncharacterized protein LOC115980745 [Quercus lobata]
MRNEVKQIFANQKISEYLNQTLIALIPKQLGPETVGQYRPISLCNIVYKIVSKILVQRIKPLLPRLISPMQAAFLEGRRGSDNVIIAQELIYSLGKRRGKEGYMVVKIDLEKAYDHLEWSFIRMILIHFGFPENIIKLILSCVATSSTSLLFNGSKLQPFCPSRGIRQGDPISPYLFLLCMEFLGAQITKMCEDNKWDMVRASRNGPSFSHVLFADDILLFAKANTKNCNSIMEVLNNFCNLAGQKVNYGKSRIFFSPNVPARRRRPMCRKLGIIATNNLGKYLGFPIIHKGRVEYYMQCHSLLVKVCDSIDKMMRDFIWGSTEERRRMHMVRWSTVTLPKELEGLGLFSMKHRNEAILARLCWRLAYEEGKPWANMLLAKYLCSNRVTEEGRHLPCSRIWAACKKGGPIYVKGLRWTVRNGEAVSMWRDIWLPCGRLRELIEGPLTREEEKLTVRQCFDDNHAWKPSSISFELPASVFNTIKATPFSFVNQGSDSLMWAYSNNGLFSIQAAYLLARGLNPLNPDTLSFKWGTYSGAVRLLTNSGRSCKCPIAPKIHSLFPLMLGWKSIVMMIWRKCIQAGAEFFAIGFASKIKQQKSIVPVGWEKPPRGWLKLNTDGSAMRNPERAGGGGLIRDHDGDWLKGFARGLGFTNSALAELWALRDGLLLAKEMGIQQLIIELDALSIVLLMNNESKNLLMEPLLSDCRSLLKEIPNKRVIHAFREANQCVDALAKIGVQSSYSFVTFCNPPPVVEDILAFDKANLCCNRLVNS